MSEISLEQTHALLEKLAEYVMNEVPTKRDVDTRFNQIDEKFQQVDERFQQVDERFQQVDERFQQVDERFDKNDERFQKIDERFQRVIDAIWELKEEKADKKDIEIVQQKLDKLLEGMDSQIRQLDIIRTEQYATSATFDRHEQRLDVLEANIDR